MTDIDGYRQAIDTLHDVYQRTGSLAAKWAATYLATDPDKLGPVGATHPRDICSRGGCYRCGPTVYEVLRAARTKQCCDLHGRNCEAPAELCCEWCTEATHYGIAPHANGSRCVLAAENTEAS